MNAQKVDLFVGQQNAEKTRIAYRYDLKKWFDWLGNEPPTPERVLDFRHFLEDTLAPKSGARIFGTTRLYYKFLGGKNPFEGIKPPRTLRNALPKVPEDVQVDEMMARVDDPIDRLVLALCLNGLRASEVADLVPEAVERVERWDATIIRVIGKGYKERLVPASRETVQALSGHTPGTRFLIERTPGRRLTLRAVEWVVEKWSGRSGNEFRPHKLRHFYATTLIRSGANVFSVQKLMGHASVSTTQVYVGMDVGDIIKATKLYDSGRKKGNLPPD